jgi:general secretion pathway protein A
VYTEFFGLNEKPFSITPDPRYLYLTNRHADALAHLIYGISESGGFIQLTGEVGTGKTTLIRSLLEQMPDKTKIAVILNPHLSALEFLAALCAELHIPLPDQNSKSALIGALNHFLLRAHAGGTRVVLIVDEAQTLDTELLEQVRLLTNLETSKQKLLQIILIGQPELRALLSRPDMRQVAQRITGRYHLEPLSREETFAYVQHRLKVAGARTEVFKPSAMRELFRRSSGIPRLINVVADRALLAGYTLDSPTIAGKLVRRAAAEVFGRPRRRWWPYPVFALVLATVSLGFAHWQRADTNAAPKTANTREVTKIQRDE